jgi:hypothetical protein
MQSLEGASALRAFRVLWDLGLGAAREQVAEVGWLTFGLALATFAGIALVDRISNEVQPPLFVLMAACFLFSSAVPRLMAVWAVLFGLAIPVGTMQIGAFAALIPAFIASGCGVAARKVSAGMTGGTLVGFAVLAGLLVGFADGTLITPIPAILGAAICGWVIGRYAKHPWPAAAALGFAVPVAIVVMMASGARMSRHHYIFVDARAAVICVAGAALGQARRRFEPKTVSP